MKKSDAQRLAIHKFGIKGKPREMVAWAAEELGMTISANSIGVMKNNIKRGKDPVLEWDGESLSTKSGKSLHKLERSSGPAPSAKIPAAKRSPNGTPGVTVTDLDSARSFVEQVGGLKKAVSTLNYIESLTTLSK